MNKQTNESVVTLRVKLNTACEMLDISRSGLAKLIKRDPTFPKPIKDGASRQAAVYFIREEVEAWLASRMAEREAASVKELNGNRGSSRWRKGQKESRG
jgi:prophage regulatory protein